jgi:hypothetical protein
MRYCEEKTSFQRTQVFCIVDIRRFMRSDKKHCEREELLIHSKNILLASCVLQSDPINRVDLNARSLSFLLIEKH